MSRRRTNEVTVVFEDGSEETVRIKPRYAIEAEEKLRTDRGGTPPLKATLYAAWLALAKPGNSFKSFVRSVEEIIVDDSETDVEDEDEDDSTPTEAASSEES